MPKVIQKRKKRVWQKYQAQHKKYVEALKLKRKYISLKAFFITFGLIALVSTVIAVKKVEYDVETLSYFKSMNQEKPSPLEIEIKEMVAGYPIEDMAPYIAKQDKDVAAFLVSIAKKESNWGKRVPVLNGQDCYNYWGYRGKRERMGTGGHTCFDSREDAVNTVAKRLDTLVSEKNLDTPAELIVWKCGNSCAGHSEGSVKKWISDVGFYFQKFKK